MGWRWCLAYCMKTKDSWTKTVFNELYTQGMLNAGPTRKKPQLFPAGVHNSSDFRPRLLASNLRNQLCALFYGQPGTEWVSKELEKWRQPWRSVPRCGALLVNSSPCSPPINACLISVLNPKLLFNLVVFSLFFPTGLFLFQFLFEPPFVVIGKPNKKAITGHDYNESENTYST